MLKRLVNKRIMNIIQKARNRWQNSVGALALIIVVVTIFSLIPLIFYKRFYFLDDTQRGAIGQWYEVGKLLAQGHLPIFNVAAQGSGNYLAEGQWGTFNPLVWLIATAVYHSSNFLIFATVFKIFLLNLLGTGTFMLAKSMSITERYATIYGIITPFVGFTLFAGASSWVTDLMVSAMFPWFWYVLRLFLSKKTGPILVFIVGYAIITIGYVFGTIMLISVMLGALVGAAVEKNWRHARKVVFLGIALAATTIAVYLPGIAISSVTMRNTEGIFNDNFLSPNLSDLFFSFSPVSYSEMNSWWMASGVTYLPFMYISWFVLLVVFIDFRQFKAFITNHRISFIQWSAPMLVTFLLLFGPANIGPLRFPVRMMAYFGQLFLLMIVLLIDNLGLRFNKTRVRWFIFVIVLGSYLEIANTPARTKSIIIINIIIAALVSALAYIGSGKKSIPLKWVNLKVKHPVLMMVSLTIALSGFSLLVQQRVIGRQNDAIQNQHITYVYPDYQMPAKKTEVLKTAEKFKGNSVVLGFNRHTIMGNDWYLTANNSMNVYTPVGFKKFSDDFRGSDPTRISIKNYSKLFELDDQTKMPLVDLLAVDTVAVGNEGNHKAYYQIVRHHNVPNGWQLTSFDSSYAIIQRIRSSQPIGSIVSSNVNGIDQIKNSNYGVKFKLPPHETTADIVFSRTAWPGYKVSGGQSVLDKPLRGYLVRIKVPASKKAATINLQFEPPFYKASVALIFFAIFSVLFWSFGRIIFKNKKIN